MSGLYLGLVALLGSMLWAIAPPAVVKPTDEVGTALLAYLCLLFLKILLDDAVHFNDKKKNGENWSHGLGLCIVWSILMLNAIRLAAGDPRDSLMYAVLAHLVGTAWIVQNYIHKAADADSADKQRHVGWAYINILSIAVLTVVNTYLGTASKELTVGMLIGLSILVVFDVIYFGTFKRVSGAFS